jgi:hypothetical protein
MSGMRGSLARLGHGQPAFGRTRTTLIDFETSEATLGSIGASI